MRVEQKSIKVLSVRSVGSVLSVLFCISWANAAAPTDVQVRASASPAQATLADLIEYRIEISGSAAGGAQPQLPNFEALGFQVAGGPSTQQSINVFNNVPAISLSYRWALRPTREGTFDIPPVVVTIPGGQSVQSNAVRVTVTKTAAPPPAVALDFKGEEIISAQTGDPNIDRQLNGRLFLRAIADKTEAYVGEQITLRYELYQAENLAVSGYGFESRPAYSGFLTETFYQPPRGQLQFRRETIGNTPFRIAPIKVVALFANKTGTTSISDMIMTADLPIESPTRRRPRSMFDDPFFDDFFGDPFGRIKRARLITRPIELRILPLPAENRPANFSGAVGELAMTAALDRTEVRQYDIVNLKVQFAGKGKVDAISPPPIPEVKGLQRFKEQSSAQPSNTANQAGGSKTFEFMMRATEAGDLQVPPIEYSIFNPRAKRYETLKTEPLALRVTPAPKSDQPIVQVFAPPRTETGETAASPVVEIARNIEYIQTTGFLGRAWLARPLYANAGFLLFQLVPIAMVIVSYAVRRRRERLEGDVAWARRRSARSVASKRLRGARRYLSAEHSATFFEELNRALRQFVADMLNQSATGITADQIAHALAARGVADGDVAEMLALIETCESARYAAGRLGFPEMQQAYDRASDLIDRLAKKLKGCGMRDEG